MIRIVVTLCTATACVAVTVAATVPASAAVAAAPPPSGLAAIQAAGARATSDRVTALTSAITRIQANLQLGYDDKDTAVETLQRDVTAMHELDAKIAADTDEATARADYQSVFTGYRVYVLAIPQAHLAIAADCITAVAVPKLTDAQHRLAAALAGPDAAKNTPQLQAELADMAAKIDAAGNVLDGVASAALAATPARWNADHGVLAPQRSAIATATADVAAARADAAAILAVLS
jgi:hypothetical protein